MADELINTVKREAFFRSGDEIDVALSRSSFDNFHIAALSLDNLCFDFAQSKDGRGFVHMDGVMLCPVGMFTPRQIKRAAKKYREASHDAN